METSPPHTKRKENKMSEKEFVPTEPMLHGYCYGQLDKRRNQVLEPYARKIFCNVNRNLHDYEANDWVQGYSDAVGQPGNKVIQGYEKAKKENPNVADEYEF